MKDNHTLVQLHNISKRYQLGMTRKSIPSLVTEWLGEKLRPQGNNHDEGSFWALRDINFKMGRGESLALVGPNGAGKTTILKLLARITKPTTGMIDVNGKLSALIELGAGFHPDLSGRENIYLNGAILGLSKQEIKRRYDDIVAFSELEPFLETPIKRYSSGMAVRLGFSVAANIDPDILLVDEVLAVGDASFRQKCMHRIQDLINNGTSIVFVSHNLWLVQAVCEKGIFMNKGQILYEGHISEVIDRYDRFLNEQRAQKRDEERLRSRVENKEIEITKIAFSSNGETDLDTLRNDQPATIHVHYHANKSLPNTNMVVRIIRSDGLSCCAMRTKLDGFQFSVTEGPGVISVTLNPLQLTGGSHYVSAVIRDDSDANSLTSSSSDWFYVSGLILSHQEMNGVFEPNRSWSQQ